VELTRILEGYSDEALDQLAADKIEEISNLRLPRSVLIQEIATALSSLSYVANALAPTRPPTYAFVKLLLDAPEHAIEVKGFADQVADLTDSITARVAEGRGLSSAKDYDLYLAILATAFESDGMIDRTEALLLSSLRRQLGIWTREHLLLEHHPDVRAFWEGGQPFERARNHLLTTGLVLTDQDRYVVADEVCRAIRRAWEIDLEDEAYRRLCDVMTTQQLRAILETAGLPLSGHKNERIERVIRGLVPPAEALNALHINEIKDICRDAGHPVSGAKAELVEGLVEFFDQGADLEAAQSKDGEQEPEDTPEPEDRAMDEKGFRLLFEQLTMDQLYDILSAIGMKRSGSKSAKIERLFNSPWAEATLLDYIRRADLADLCRRLGVNVSGVKDELIDRLVNWAARGAIAISEEAPPSDEASASLPLEPRTIDTQNRQAETHTAEEPVPPAGLKDVEADFPALSKDEQIIVALLKGARSLTEKDLERAAHRHQLGWFLNKAHMADMMARLRLSGQNPIRVRSVGATNIYEWVGHGGSVGEQLGKQAARDLVDALRQGVVPEKHLDKLCVGQEAVRKHLVELLDHVRTGRSEFKFVRGPYGSGKTFLCSWLREQAYHAEFAVSTVRIGPEQPLSDLPVFFSGIVAGLRTPEKRHASALPDILESWLLGVHRRTCELEGIDPMDAGSQPHLASVVEGRIEQELARLDGVDPGFGPAMRSFYRAQLDADQERAAAALSWMRGSRSVPNAMLKEIGVRGHLEDDQVFPRLTALLEVIRGGRLQGLLLLVDELELVRRMPHARQREQAYETLRLLIDEAGENDLPGCLLVFTGTDQLFEDNRYGMSSYEALAHRISAPETTEGLVSMRQPVIRLQSLDRGLLLEVAKAVRRIHGVAYGWHAQARVPDDSLEHLVATWTSFGSGDVDRLPRPTLRHLVHVLDLCEENPNVSAEDCMQNPQSRTDDAEALAGMLEP
jgi:hypothetical protein